jgi:hypothetical protein
MGTAQETIAALRVSRERELRKEALANQVPECNWVLEPATGVLAPEPEIEAHPEELAVPHPAAHPARAPRRQPAPIQSPDYVWD